MLFLVLQYCYGTTGTSSTSRHTYQSTACEDVGKVDLLQTAAIALVLWCIKNCASNKEALV